MHTTTTPLAPDAQLHGYLTDMMKQMILLESDITNLSVIVTTVTLSTLSDAYDILHILMDKLDDFESHFNDADEEYEELALKGKCSEEAMEENKTCLASLWKMHGEFTEGYFKLKLLLDVFEQATLFDSFEAGDDVGVVDGTSFHD